MAPITPATTIAPPTTAPRLLVVDDEPHLVELFRDIVGSDTPCQIQSAASLSEARRILEDQKIDLLVTDVHLPDGDGTALVKHLHSRQPLSAAIVITGQPSIEGAITAIRSGAVDFLAKPFSARQLVERVRLALHRQSADRQKNRRMERLRQAVRRLSESRRLVARKVDLLCNDLVTAYGELSRQLDAVRTQENFRQLISEARDLEQLLCHTMDWLLRQTGYSNIALWLATDDHQFQLGAYMKYTMAGEPALTDPMQKGLLPLLSREGFLQLSGEELGRRLSPAEASQFSDQMILGSTCTYLAEPLAAIVMFRDASNPFSQDDAAILKAVAPIFATRLAGMVPGRAAEDACDSSGGSEGWTDPAPPSPGKKPDPADWWKRGEAPPF